MRRLLPALALVFLACGEERPAPPAALERKVPRRPIVLVSIDSLRADHLSAWGRVPEFGVEERTSPFLDRIAQEGVRFAQAEAPTSWTLPSHVSLLTGSPSLEHGVRTRAKRLDPRAPTLAGRLRAAGWRTAGFYSAPFLHPAWGFGEGFESYRAALPWLASLETERAIEDNSAEALAPLHGRAHADAQTAERVVDAALGWLEEDERWKEPFFVFLHVWDPHYDYAPPREVAKLFVPDGRGPLTFEGFVDGDWEPITETPRAKALYDAEIRYVDRELERFWTRIEAWGRADEVLLAVVADHGDEFFEHGARGHHKTLYEEVTHVPMLLRAPGLVPAGVVVRAPVALYDLAPTLLDLSGLPPFEGRGGRSLRPAWESPATFEPRPILMDLLLSKGGEVLAWRDGKTKLHWFPGAERGLVFDLERDPGERAPRALDAGADPPVMRRLRAAVAQAREGRGLALPMREGQAMRDALGALGYTEGGGESGAESDAEEPAPAPPR